MTPETTSVRIGCAGLPAGVGHAAYFKKLALLEVELSSPPQRDAVLRRWRAAAPEGCVFTARTVITTPGKGWAETLAAATLLQAERIVLETPPAFSPSAANREALKAFFAQADSPIPLAWEPRGIWSPAEATRFAGEQGVLTVFDPLQVDLEGDLPPPGEQAYLRIRAPRLSRGQLDDLVERIVMSEQAWVVFVGSNAFADAQRLTRQILDAAADADGDGDEGEDE